MSVSPHVVTSPQTRIRRKPAPSLVLDARYPSPDPEDPFAPLSVLRSRTASALTFYGHSTSHLPNLPYTGGRPFPPDPYSSPPAAAAAPSASSAKKLQVVTTWATRSTVDLTQNTQQQDYARGPEILTPRWPSPSQDYPHSQTSFSPPIRRRSQSAVSRKEARLTAPASPRTSPYGHSNLQAYVLASTHCPPPAFTAEPSAMDQTSTLDHGNHSGLALGQSMQCQSQARLTTFSTEVPPRPKGGKLARLLVKKSRSRLSLSQIPSENPSSKRHHASLLAFPTASSAATTKQVAEENTFRPRRKSSALLSPTTFPPPLGVSDVSTGVLAYEPLTDAELGYLSEPGSSDLHSLPQISAPIPLAPKKAMPIRSQTAPIYYDLTEPPRQMHQITRSSTAPPAPLPPFDEHALPTHRQLVDAASYTVIAENGLRVPFGDLFREQKTVVIFIRHFWCPLCQDYMFSVSGNADPRVLKQAGVNLVIIGNGSYNMIKSYRQIFRTPFAIYTDPSLRVYTALGMTLHPPEHTTEPRRRGYVRHGPMGGIKMVVLNALRVGMPVWEKGGDVAQLGGEFVLGPGLTATFAHRMRTTRSHAPIVSVLAAAGIDLYTHVEQPVMRRETAGRSLVLESEVDEDQWMEERRLSLARMKQKKMARRMGLDSVPTTYTDSGCEGDVETSGSRFRRPTVMSRTESSIAEEQEEEDHPLPAIPNLADAGVGASSETAENGDTDTASVETQTAAESDGESDRTRADEHDMKSTRDFDKVEKSSFDEHVVLRPVLAVAMV